MFDNRKAFDMKTSAGPERQGGAERLLGLLSVSKGGNTDRKLIWIKGGEHYRKCRVNTALLFNHPDSRFLTWDAFILPLPWCIQYPNLPRVERKSSRETQRGRERNGNYNQTIKLNFGQPQCWKGRLNCQDLQCKLKYLRIAPAFNKAKHH